MADNDRVLYCVFNVGAEATEVEARALTGVHNVGAEATEVTGRALYAPWNVGIEVLEVADRALHVVWNIGAYSVLLARALYAAWAVILRTGEDDPLEIQLMEKNLKDILHILRGK